MIIRELRKFTEIFKCQSFVYYGFLPLTRKSWGGGAEEEEEWGLCAYLNKVTELLLLFFLLDIFYLLVILYSHIMGCLSFVFNYTFEMEGYNERSQFIGFVLMRYTLFPHTHTPFLPDFPPYLTSMTT